MPGAAKCNGKRRNAMILSEKQILNEKQEIALLVLISGETRKAAAQAAGVDVATIFRWLKQPEFQAVLTAKRAEMFEQGLNSLYSLTREAAETLRKMMRSKHAPTRTRAALGVLTLAFRAKDLEIEKRLERLEKQILE